MAARFPVGPGRFADVGDVIGATIGIGDTGGEEKHVLLLAEMAAHRHGLAPDPCNVFTGVSSGGAFTVTTDATLPPHKVQTFDTEGEDVAHNNLPPYQGVWFARRTARLMYTV
jgi:microcystin-dependent protein